MVDWRSLYFLKTFRPQSPLSSRMIISLEYSKSGLEPGLMVNEKIVPEKGARPSR
jgi:hypothetical protein